MGPKERCQLLDVQPQWGCPLLEMMWNWEGGWVLPCRLYVEFLMSASRWMGALKAQATGPVRFRELLGDDPARLVGGSILLTPPGEMVAGTNLQRRGYYQWLWEPEQSFDVTKASKADEATADTESWAVGGLGDGMENYRDRIRRFLLRRWRQRLTREVITWLKTVEHEPHFSRHRDAAVEGLSRCLDGGWFDWSNGSRLLYWRWPPC